MNPIVKGLIIAIIHVCLVSALGAKLLYDRATLPRTWVKAAPYDPNLPIRGRYVSLQVVVEPRGIKETKPGPEWQPAQSVTLRVENNRLLAEAKQKNTPYNPSGLHVRYAKVGDENAAVLDEPVAFFIPEHVADPSRRPPGEQLWVETTIPKKGMPRPIRLGVKKNDGPIVPLDLK
jgi:hypothetical protein